MKNTPAQTQVQNSWTPEKVLLWAGLLVFLLITFLPLVVLLFRSISSAAGGQNELWSLMLPTGRTFILILRSLLLALMVSVTGSVIGFLVACFLWRFRSGPGYWLRWLLVPLIAIPPYIHTLSWGVISSNSIGGWVGTWWVLLMATLPIQIGLILIGLEAVDPKLIESGRINKPDIRVLRDIVLPLAGPAIMAAGGFAFLITLTDYTVPSLYLVNVYPFEIFAEFSATGDPSRAFMLSVPLLVITVLVLYFSLSNFRKAAMKGSWQERAWTVPPSFPPWFEILMGLGLLVVGGLVLVLLALPFMEIGSISEAIATISQASDEISFTFYLALLVSVLVIPVSLALAIMLNTDGKAGKLWWLPGVAPLAIPAPLIGIGLIAIWNHPSTNALYTSIWMPVMASLARFAPIAAIVMLSQLKRIDPELIEAAMVIQKNRWRTWLGIQLPMVLPGIVASMAIVFALTVGELGATLLVTPPGHSTLTIRIYNYLHYGSTENVVALSLVIVGMTVLGAIIAVLGYLFMSRRVLK